jgi:hypothetical protein
VSAQRKDFIVLAIGHRDGEEFRESAYLQILQLIDWSAPDARVCSPRGFVAYYLCSTTAVAAVTDIISRVDTLRDTRTNYSSLGIGLAHGPLIADFDWGGRVKPSSLPLGEVANAASVAVRQGQIYRNILSELQHPSQT